MMVGRLETLDLGMPVSVRVVDGGDEVVWSEVWRDDCYRLGPDEVGNRVLVDVGANVGMTTLRAMSAGAAGVLAVEPDAQNFRRLQENVAENSLRDRVRTVEGAVWSYSGAVPVDRDTHPEGNYGGVHVAGAHQNGPLVPAFQLHDLLEWVSAEAELVLKVDTEGAEYKIVHDGVDPAVLRRFALIVGEFHHFPARGVGGRDALGRLVTKLLETHTVEVFGRPDDGGLFWARRYAS